MDEHAWQLLMDRLRSGLYAPFLGAAVSSPPLPTAPALSERLAERFLYPMEDRWDLKAVSQYKAVMTDHVFVKDVVCEELQAAIDEGGAKRVSGHPHDLLARLPLKIYLTTNYDLLLEDALIAVGRQPVTEYCRWNSELRRGSRRRRPAPDPTVQSPLVFHLHGTLRQASSIVLTEDDYYDFVVNMSRDGSMIPPLIQEVIANHTLLFVGYGLKDWNLRVLLRGLVAAQEGVVRRAGVSVQLPPTVDESRRREVEEYLERYFEALELTVYWGTKEQFFEELRQRWERVSSDDAA